MSANKSRVVWFGVEFGAAGLVDVHIRHGGLTGWRMPGFCEQRFTSILCLLLAWATTQRSHPAPAAELADVIFRHGRVYTVNEKQPIAEALAVKDGKLLFVGSDDGAGLFRGAGTRVVDLGGHTVVPGLTDSHCHL